MNTTKPTIRIGREDKHGSDWKTNKVKCGKLHQSQQ